MDTELLRLYMAISIANLCDDAIANGVSVMDAEDLKRECLIELSQLKQVGSMTELSINMAIKYNSLYISQLNNQYSYCVSQAIEYIKQHRLTPCTPKLVSEYLDVNPSYLSRKFHDETGTTLTNYIKKEKMTMATELLNRKLYSLHEISSLLGYENYSYFSRVYKEYYGVSPSHNLKE
ncbi:MAG: helix-turn-helix transcriptional regulator [Lachnospiraceae bacterium]|nr:helix-turn-helix transcriptional regulator [Lachnospiraceae bacterium]